MKDNRFLKVFLNDFGYIVWFFLYFIATTIFIKLSHDFMVNDESRKERTEFYSLREIPVTLLAKEDPGKSNYYWWFQCRYDGNDYGLNGKTISIKMDAEDVHLFNVGDKIMYRNLSLGELSYSQEKNKILYNLSCKIDNEKDTLTWITVFYVAALLFSLLLLNHNLYGDEGFVVSFISYIHLVTILMVGLFVLSYNIVF